MMNAAGLSHRLKFLFSCKSNDDVVKVIEDLMQENSLRYHQLKWKDEKIADLKAMLPDSWKSAQERPWFCTNCGTTIKVDTIPPREGLCCNCKFLGKEVCDGR